MNYKEVLKKSGCSVACTHFLGNCSTSHPPADPACNTGCSCKTALHDLAGGGLCACDMVLVLSYCRRFFAWVDSGLPACLSGGEAPGCRDAAVAVDGDDQKCAGGIVRRDLSDLAVRPESVGIHIVPDRNSDHISECLRGTTCRKPGDAGGRNSLSAAMAQTLPLYRAAEASSVSSFCLPCDNRYGMEGRYRRRDHRRAERFDRQDALYSKNIP